jgi:hypothetical protein
MTILGPKIQIILVDILSNAVVNWAVFVCPSVLKHNSLLIMLAVTLLKMLKRLSPVY